MFMLSFGLLMYHCVVSKDILNCRLELSNSAFLCIAVFTNDNLVCLCHKSPLEINLDRYIQQHVVMYSTQLL